MSLEKIERHLIEIRYELSKTTLFEWSQPRILFVGVNERENLRESTTTTTFYVDDVTLELPNWKRHALSNSIVKDHPMISDEVVELSKRQTFISLFDNFYEQTFAKKATS